MNIIGKTEKKILIVLSAKDLDETTIRRALGRRSPIYQELSNLIKKGFIKKITGKFTFYTLTTKGNAFLNRIGKIPEKDYELEMNELETEEFAIEDDETEIDLELVNEPEELEMEIDVEPELGKSSEIETKEFEIENEEPEIDAKEPKEFETDVDELEEMEDYLNSDKIKKYD